MNVTLNNTMNKNNRRVISKSQMKKSIFISFIIIIILLSFYPILQNITRHGTYGFNAALLSVGSLFAIVTGIAFIFLHIKNSYNWMILVGIAYLLIGLIDIIHGFFLFSSLLTDNHESKIFINKIISTTENIGDLCFVISLSLALLYRKVHANDEYIKFKPPFFIAYMIFMIILIILLFNVDFQEYINYHNEISHPINLFLAFTFFIILILLSFSFLKDPGRLRWWMFLSVSIMFAAQIYLSVSKGKLDAIFEFALFLKLLAYLTVLSGIFIYVVGRIKQMQQAELILLNQKYSLQEVIAEQTLELKEKNKKLINEIITKNRLFESLEKSKEQLKESEAHYRELFEDSIIGMYQISTQGKILRANKALCNLLGFNSFLELIKFNSNISAFISSKERKLFKESIEKNGFIIGFETTWLSKEKKRIHVRESAKKKTSKNKTIYEGTVEDITHEKIIEDQKKQKIKELENIIETVNVPIFGVNKNKEIIIWNFFTEQITGYSREEVLKKNITDSSIKQLFNKDFSNLCQDALQGKSIKDFAVSVQSKEGKDLKFLLNTSTQYNTAEDITGALFIARDITQLDRYKDQLEKEVAKRTKELENALKAEKELSQLKSRFVSTVSHEFRTPLAAISFAAGFVLKYWNRLDEKTREQKLLKIENQVQNMIFLLDEVLTLEKGAAGKVKLNKKIFYCSDFFSSLIEEVYSFSPGTHKIIFDTVQDDCTIYIDEKLGRKIFINLLTNAIKFSPDSDKVVLKYRCENNFTIVDIIDFGVGISSKDLDKIFIPFHRAENVEPIRGTGLGLAIVKDSVDRLNGFIEVESEEGKGTHFTVKLPLTDNVSSAN